MRTNVSFDQKRITTENEIATNCIPINYYVEPNSPIDNFMKFALLIMSRNSSQSGFSDNI